MCPAFYLLLHMLARSPHDGRAHKLRLTKTSNSAPPWWQHYQDAYANQNRDVIKQDLTVRLFPKASIPNTLCAPQSKQTAFVTTSNKPPYLKNRCLLCMSYRSRQSHKVSETHSRPDKHKGPLFRTLLKSRLKILPCNYVTPVKLTIHHANSATCNPPELKTFLA